MTNKPYYSSRDSITESPWQAGLPDKPEISSPDLSVIYDAAVVGAGITGITTALMLQQAGKRCIILEAGEIGFGTTGGTSAHLNTFFDTTYPEIESGFGAEATKSVADSGKEAFRIIKELIDRYHIDCDFQYKDAYLYSENDKESKQLREILEASRKAGIDVAECSKNDVPVPFQLAIHFTGQGQFHPLKYLYRLAGEFIKLGGVIQEQAFISKSTFENDLHIITDGSRTVKAKNLVYATHVPPGITRFTFTCAPYRSYVLGFTLKNENYPSGLSYDMQEPYHYFRTHEIDGQPYLILGGEDHKTGHDNPEEAFSALEQYARKYYDVDSIAYKWSSQYYVPADGLPYIGHTGDHTYVATGFNGNGMMFGTLSAKIISDQILKVSNPYSDLYSPSRIKPIAGFSEFIKENADSAFRFIADRFSKDEIDSLSELQAGQGVITDLKGKKAAVYKDKDGRISALSATCTHAGCIVNFNAAEQSWDCPCHGGRFDTDGKVITGPPQKDLEKIIIE